MPTLTYPATLDQLDTMLEWIYKEAKKVGFNEQELYQIRLVAEEVLVNIINYGYPDKNGDIQINLIPKEKESLTVEVVDSGIPFDPLSRPDPDLSLPLEDRKVGGLGVFLLRKLMDEVDYKRKNNRNILTFVKRIEKPAEEPSYKWPLEFMKKETFKKGDFLFKAGDTADKMFYIKKGSIKLLEINKVVREGEVIGEMGIFSPFKVRTASAQCDQDLEAFTMGKDEVMKFFKQDPALAINLIQLSIKRFIENLRTETAARERIASELRIAQDIQKSMLPQVFPPFPDRKEFEIFATMDAAKEVGGDFYDFFFVDKHKLCVIIGDVSGKGVPAALFMAISKTLFKSEALRGLPPAEVLTVVNNLLCPDNQMCMFVTVFCLMLNTETGEIEFANGGHNPPLLCLTKGYFQFLEIPKGFVVGAMENTSCISKTIILQPGDKIFLYTDGVTEAMNPQKQLFSEEKLKESLCRVKDKDIKNIVSSIRQDLLDYAQDEPQSDDITMLVLKYNGKGA